jgi:hypothetical protein
MQLADHSEPVHQLGSGLRHAHPRRLTDR